MFLAPLLAVVLAVAPVALGEESCEDGIVPPQFLQKSLQLQQENNIGTDANKLVKSSNKKSGGVREVQTYHFYVNFHGVDPVLATLMNVLHQAGVNCSTCGLHLLSCEEEGLNVSECLLRDATCLQQPVSCTKDSGLRILEAGVKGQNFSSVNTSDFSSLKNLWPDRKRHNLLASSALASHWLPSQWGPSKRVLITTILRDPVERLRSVFYTLSPDHSPEKFKDFLKVQQTMALTNQTSDGWHWRKAIQGCCEYAHYLSGNCDVLQSKKVLASQFDFVGIAESLPQTLVALAWLYGKTPEGMGILARDTSLKVPEPEEWDQHDLEVAKNVTAKDREIYDFGKELFHRQAVSMWNNADVLEKQAKKLEDAWNIPWEPE